MKDKILVAKWGYSMILATWCKVIKESPKTLLVKEIKSRSLSSDELKEKNLTVSYLQEYSLPVDEPANKSGLKESESFRLYKRGNEWIGHPKDMHIKLYFSVWNGEPEFEDHCD